MEHIIPWRESVANVRWNVVVQVVLALTAFAVGGALRLQANEHITRYVSPAGITTVIVESPGVHFGDALACSPVGRAP